MAKPVVVVIERYPGLDVTLRSEGSPPAQAHPESIRPKDYRKVFDADRPPFDFVWFTPRVDLLDPCEAFAEQLERARKRHEKGQGE